MQKLHLLFGDQHMMVLKFGGSSVADAQKIEKVIEIISCKPKRSVIVLSAMQGVTDTLINVAKAAEQGDEGFRDGISEIERRHKETLEELVTADNETFSYIERRISELKNLCEGVYLLRELTPKTLDRILSFGELLLSRIFFSRLKKSFQRVVWKDARDLICTDSNFGSALVDFERTNEKIRNFFEKVEDDFFVVPGFIASDANGATTTLGRGGSDYTAAIIAAGVEAEALEIWTDVSGMMTADPKLVRNALSIPHISYREAMELSHFGAKVIYPPTIQPVMAKNIPVLIKNTFAPEDCGTLISSQADSDGIVRGISSIDKIAVLNLEGSGMVGVPGFSKRLFSALAEARINVVLITQSSSEHSICVCIDERFADVAKQVVDCEFAIEIAAGRLEPLRVEKGFSILAIVGDRMRSHAGISGKMFSALGWQGVNIHAIAQGSSERNISAVINSRDVKKAVNALHEEFFSDGKKQINLYIAGVGNVGSKFLEQIESQREFLSEVLRLNVRVVGLANSKKMIFDADGLETKDFFRLLKESDLQSDAKRFADIIIENNLRNSIFVDITADESLIQIYPMLLEKSVSVVACNKAAASSDYKTYKRLKDLAREYNANFLFETNVGAGLPVVSTLNDLLRSGDEILRIEAILSGTLQFVFNNYDGRTSFASVVRLAQRLGYTEPDPRIDLSGIDVAKKILILTREVGYEIELDDVKRKSFIPESCFSGDVEDFYAEIEKQESYFRHLLTKARSKGKVLRYVASMRDGKAEVGLTEIGQEHEFAFLSGKDNAVLFYTKRYKEPLVVKGAGAGAEVTAAGVFADVIRAARI